MTIDTFRQWRAAWEAEKEEIKRKTEDLLRDKLFINGLTYADVWSKPTGKEYFLQRGRAAEEEAQLEALDQDEIFEEDARYNAEEEPIELSLSDEEFSDEDLQ